MHFGTLATHSLTRQAGLVALASLVVLWALLPLLWAAASAVRPQEDIFKYLSPLSPQVLIPTRVTGDNFIGLWQSGFLRAMLNSFVVAIGTVIVGLSISATAAFGLSALQFPGRGLVFALFVVSFLVPFDAIAVPLATLFRALGLQDTYVGLILPGLGSGLAIFLLRQFFLGIPKDLSDAAQVDGMSWWGILWKIYVPLSQPALIGAGLILFVFQWHAFLWPLLIAPSSAVKVAPVALAEFAGQFNVDFGQMFAGVLLTALVPLTILLVFQRYFTESLATTGGKL